MIAVGEGRVTADQMQYRRRSMTDWRQPTSDCTRLMWNWADNDYRRKPEPRYRPWTQEECPVGAVVRHQRTGERFAITGAGAQQIFLVDEDYSYETMLKAYVMDADGSPCGTLEDDNGSA